MAKQIKAAEQLDDVRHMMTVTLELGGKVVVEAEDCEYAGRQHGNGILAGRC